MKFVKWAVGGLVAVATLVGNVRGATTVLYDGSLGTAPTAQGWLSYASSDFASHFTSTTKTTLDTTAGAGILAGFSNYNAVPATLVNPVFPALDRTAGFAIHIEGLKINSESHGTPDRAGFSIIALGSDHKGIELGFWQDRIFAQNDSPLFTHGEEKAFPGLQAAQTYDLYIVGNAYQLLVGGDIVLLSGAVRDYSAFVPTPPLANVYAQPSFLFFGDDTSSAAASVEFSQIRVTTVVPEPAAIGVLALAVLGPRRRRVFRPINPR